MTAPLQILLVEDSEDDSILIAHTLKRAGLNVVHHRVETPEGFEAALRRQSWDVIICDHNIPRYSIGQALKLVKQLGLDIPFIIVSGNIGEELAVSAMKAGAHDYLMKQNMVRLAPAIEREMRDADVRRQQRKTEDERVRLLVSEKRARQQAEEACRLKDEFLANVSHELRTPLTSLLGWIRLLQGGKLDAGAAERALATIERNAYTQTRLVEELLDISRITSGKLKLNRVPCSLATVFNNAIDVLRPALEVKKIRLETAFAPFPPVLMDTERMQQVFWNLLSNAVKFTQPGGHIHISANSESGDIVIKVRDNGLGIAADFLPYVFERFRQADSSTTRLVGGLGIGLSIVRSIVELHGGTVSVVSEGVGMGSTFEVRLPLKATAVPPELSPPDFAQTECSSLGMQTLDQLTVLVVDDDNDTRELLVSILEQFGATVLQASSAATALEILEHSKPAVLVSDVAMPGEDGYALLRRVRNRQDDLRQIPAIAITAYIKSEDRERALAAGFHIHLAKPVEPETLVRAVSEAAHVYGQAT